MGYLCPYLPSDLDLNLLLLDAGTALARIHRIQCASFPVTPLPTVKGTSKALPPSSSHRWARGGLLIAFNGLRKPLVPEEDRCALRYDAA